MKKTVLCTLILLLCTAVLFGGCRSESPSSKSESLLKLTDALSSVDKDTSDDDAGEDDISPKSTGWFDDAIFVGDSVTLRLKNYCLEHSGALGEATFYCAGSLGYTNALWDLDREDAVHPEYQGENHLVEDCVALTGKKHVFIMLGMNDIGAYGVDGAMESCDQLITRLLEKSPDAKIYIQSVTPMIDSSPIKSEYFNNTLVREFDERLKAYCEEKGFKYLDLYSALADQKGDLPMEYCSDPDTMGLHFSETACEKWIDYLKKNA